MPQLFPRSSNQITKVTIVGTIVLLALAGVLLYALEKSPFVTKQGIYQAQTVPFSHDHHTAGLGIDCRYCHTAVETSNFAGVPPTATCMNCHKQIWANTDMLRPVRESWATGQNLVWNRVNDLPDFVYFNHSIHVFKGIGCRTCHGPVNEMPLVYQHANLQMRWCLECHRNPEKFVRPREEVFNMDWTPADSGTTQAALGPQLVAEYEIQSLDYCSVCHR